MTKTFSNRIRTWHHAGVIWYKHGWNDLE